MRAAGPADAPVVVPPRPAAQGFGRRFRILSRREFLRIQGQGQRVHSRHFVFQFLPGARGESRLGITVSRKVGNAVVRNRIKRWVREAFRRHPELRPGPGDPRRPYDLVITAKRDAVDFAWQPIHDEIVQQLTRYLEQRGSGRAKPGAASAKRPRPRDGGEAPDKG